MEVAGRPAFAPLHDSVVMKTKKAAGALRSRRVQEAANGNDDDAVGTPTMVNMSLLSNTTNYVDNNGIGHVKVKNTKDWPGIFSKESTVHLVYEGSGSSGEILIVPANHNVSDANAFSFSGSDWNSESNLTKSADSSPTEPSEGGNFRDTKGLVRTGSNSILLVIVGTALALIAIVSVLAVVIYSRRNRRRAYSEDPSSSDEPFIVGSLPLQPVPGLSVLDTDMSPDLWLEGQYQYSPNMSRLVNSFNGTAILSDNSTSPMNHHRLTVDARPSSRRGHCRNGGRGDAGRDQRENAGRDRAEYGDSGRGDSVRGKGDSRFQGGRRDNSAWRDNGAHRDRGILDDISDQGRRRRGTTPIVLYDENSTEEYKSDSSRTHHLPRTSLSSQQQRQHHQEQQRQRRRDKYASKRDK